MYNMIYTLLLNQAENVITKEHFNKKNGQTKRLIQTKTKSIDKQLFFDVIGLVKLSET